MTDEHFRTRKEHLTTPPAAASAHPLATVSARSTAEAAPEVKDVFREVVETVVFVIVLVLLLKTFVAEAFVIPTGSMATTLLGYHFNVECPQCGHRFPVNRSREVEDLDFQRRPTIVGCTCPNCRYDISLSNADPDNPWNHNP